MANSREEQLRNSRRLARQILGVVALVLVVIGLFTVLNWCVGAIRAALDDSDRRERFADRVYGLVMFDFCPLMMYRRWIPPCSVRRLSGALFTSPEGRHHG